jgi:hypothetical protein
MKKVFIYLLITFCSFINYAQNVGIGTTTPLARLHVVDSSVLFSAVGLAPANAGNTPLHGVGRRMMWYADKAAFRTGYASSNEWDGTNIGKYSFAAGYGVKALGDFSFSAGLNNSSGGIYSIAMGNNAVANADFSVAIGSVVFATGGGAMALGYGNTAQGINSLAMGLNNYSKSFGGTVLGQYNDVNDNPDSNIPSSLDRIFQIGNGYYDESFEDEVRKNAITILRNGNTGVGTVTPAARLHVSDSSVVFTGESWELPATIGNPPITGSGRRMMWYPDKAAFRVGAVNGSNWDKDSIGIYSFASGRDNKAIGDYCTSMGLQSTAIGLASFSIGHQAIAGNDYTISMGVLSTASGQFSTCIGTGPKASGLAAMSIGNNTTASGDYSTCMGMHSIAKAFGSFTIGTFNDDTDIPDPAIMGGPNDRIFQIGNGEYMAKSNAITVLRNGNVGIGTLTPSQKLHVAGNIFATGSITPSDARFKKDVEPIHNSLDKIKQINGVTYYYRSAEFKDLGFTDNEQVGVIAQEIEKILPQLVFTDDKGYKAVDYTKLVPLLIEGIKEQQKQIETSSEEIRQLKADMAVVKKVVEQLIKAR